MTPAINNVLNTIRHRLQEEAVAWGPDMKGMASTNLSGSKPGEGGATNETDIPDALDKYLGGIADQLVANYGLSDQAAFGKISATARKLANDGTLPSLPGENAADEDISVWLGKAASIGFAQHVFQAAGDGGE